MDSLESLLAQARAGRFKGCPGNIATLPNAANDAPASPIDAANALTPTEPLPYGLERATAALTAAERALLTPAVYAALAAEVPGDCWADYTDLARRDWVRERLGLSVRFWNVTTNGRRWLVQFAEPITRSGGESG